MANTGFFHHIGTFLLFAACILLIVSSISAPVVDHISMLRVNLANHSALTFGTFGHCILDTAADNHDFCTKHAIGYSPAAVLQAVDGTSFTHDQVSATKGLTRAMVLHPVGAGLAFLAFVLAAGAGVIGSFMAAAVALLTLVVTIVVLITDFVLFRIIRDHVNSAADDPTPSHARFGVATWTVLAAAVALLLGAIVVFLSCCSARLHHQHRSSTRGPSAKADPYIGTPVTRRRRRFWQRR